MDPGASLSASGQSYVWRRAALQGQGLCRHRDPRDSQAGFGRSWFPAVGPGLKPGGVAYPGRGF